MDRQEFIGKLNSIYVGENNAIDEIISEYDRLNNIINEAIEYAKTHIIEDSEYENYMQCEREEKEELLSILQDNKGE